MTTFDRIFLNQENLRNSIREGIHAGALAKDEEVLDAIGARTSKTNGAGTVSAAAAIYFASRYAASPLEGLKRSASTVGADTDTVASMTGALIGAFSSREWYSSLTGKLQDGQYIQHVAKSLVEKGNEKNAPRSQIKRSDITRLLKAMNENETDKTWVLPNEMTVSHARMVHSKGEISNSNFPQQWEVVADEGLTLFVKGKSISAEKKARDSSSPTEVEQPESSYGVVEEFIGVSLAVSNLENSSTFYERILGLTASGRTSRTLRFGTNLALREEPLLPNFDRPVIIFLQVTNLRKMHERLMEFKYPSVGEIVEKSNRKTFECTDPDGYIIEMVERKSLG